MKLATFRRVIALGIVVAASAALPGGASAQVDVAGTWALEVRTDNGVTNPSVTFAQEGGALTGQYSSEALGDNRVSGSVDGSEVTWSFDADLQGQSVGVVYRGTVAADGSMSGTIDIAGGMLTGTFTATRSPS